MSSCASLTLTLTRLVLLRSGTYAIHSCDRGEQEVSLIVGYSWVTVGDSLAVHLFFS